MHRRPFVAEDLFQMKMPGQVATSPDGSKVLFTVTEALAEENSYSVGGETIAANVATPRHWAMCGWATLQTACNRSRRLSTSYSVIATQAGPNQSLSRTLTEPSWKALYNGLHVIC